MSQTSPASPAAPLGGVTFSGPTAPAPLSAGDLREALCARLKGSAELAALVGARVYPLHVPESVSLASQAALTYALMTAVPVQNLGGPAGLVRARVRLAVLSKDYDLVWPVLATLRRLLDGYRGAWPLGLAVVETTLVDESDADDPPVDASDAWTYRSTQDYSVRFRQT